MFAYCGNNPIVFKDQSGNIKEWALNGIVYSYNSTAADFHRFEHGQSPIEYESALIKAQQIKESYYFSEMRIDTDGVTPNGKSKYGKNHQTQTSILNGVLDAEIHHYVVLPGGYSGKAKLGDLAVVIDHATNNYLYAVIADIGPKGSCPGEVSISVCWDLGYESNGYYGPRGNFEIVYLPGTKINLNIDAAKLNYYVDYMGRVYY